MKHALMMLLALLLVPACTAASKTTSEDSMTDKTYLTAMEEEHAGEKPEPSGAEAQPDGGFGVSSGATSYGEIDGRTVTGYVARPVAAEPDAGLILIHEWWGLNDNVKEMADKFASHGYVVLAVDLYDGEVASAPGEAKSLMSTAMQTPDAGVKNLKLARQFLDAEGVDKVGVLGWCFGGGWALQAAITQGDEIDAVVMYYGRVKTEPSEVRPLTAPLLGIFAADDQGIPVEQVRQFEAALNAAGEDAEVHIYDGVGHAFANPSGEHYNKEAAADAWKKVTAFLAEHLQS